MTSMTIPNDNTGRPNCRGRSPADLVFNYDNIAWGVCVEHRVRWGITRRLGTLPDGTAQLMARLTEVEPVLHVGRAG